MKTLIKYILFACVLLFASCDLNLQPISEIGEGNFYQNTDEVYAAVVACYNGLQKPMENEWALTELRSDNSRLYSTATTSTANMLLMNLDQAKATSTNQHVYDYWYYVYHNIARCNTVLKAQNLAVVDNDSIRGVFEGEARFIRAYHYFNLLRLFGPVFIVSERISAEEAKTFDRSPVGDVYDFILEDLKFAAGSLPDKYPAAQKGRITSWAAKSLLAKVYVTLGKIDSETKELLKDIYENSGHKLETSYEKVFDAKNELNDEIIFTIRYISGGINLGSPFGNYFAPLQSGSAVINYSGNGYNYPTTGLTQAYTKNDSRRNATIALDYVDDLGNTVVRSYVTKYLSPVTLKEDGDKDWPVIRFADMILLYAEVVNELDNPAAALPFINETRTRAGLNELKERDVPNKHEMRMAIEKERRLELAYENHRWFDLIRTERVLEVVNSHYANEVFYEEVPGAGPLTSQTVLLPIPQKEIDINPHISQNPGY
ncbi:MAG: RagB/SusD family nutrient uptake outer membrane protein [Prevotellaceae bacterium]|jgi:hypothetical protein|nr:RagB/SusD family nutrient uptake outer membrane protein [Prevotellaceae bacterium]